MIAIKWHPSIRTWWPNSEFDLSAAANVLTSDLSAQDAVSYEHDEQRVAALLNVLEHYSRLLPSSALPDKSSVEKDFKMAVETQDPEGRNHRIDELAAKYAKSFRRILKDANLDPEELQKHAMFALNPLSCAPFTSISPFAAGRTFPTQIVQD